LGAARRDKRCPLLRDQGSPGKATTILQPVSERFTEGFDTADLIAAKQLLDDLDGAETLPWRA
jgi:hypothetical protein